LKKLNTAALKYSLENGSLPYRVLLDEKSLSYEACYSRISLLNTLIHACDEVKLKAKSIYWLEKLNFSDGIFQWVEDQE